MSTTPPDLPLPAAFETRRLVRGALQVVALLGIVGLVALLAPGLGEVRDTLAGAALGWVALAVALEAASCVSYVVMFRPVFCRSMGWRSAWEIGWSELAMGSIVPASGAGGLALGAWVLRRGGMSVERIARRSVAFFLIKSSVNFVAVAVVGGLLALGLVGPELSFWLTGLPAILAVALLAGVVALPHVVARPQERRDAGRVRRAAITAWDALLTGTREAVEIVRSGNVAVIAGAIGYWAFDNAVLWATFEAFGEAPPLSVILLAYLIGQLGGLLPIPGGVGGIDGGLIGTFIVFGADPAATVAAVFTYRLILFWLPLVVGGASFWSLRRGMGDARRSDICTV
jgi:uncharacterized protein (TIRG00374 family)